MKRWSLDVIFEESRAHLGIETQCQWSDRATRCLTPLLSGLYSLLALFGQVLHPAGQVPVAQTAWCRKHTATFRDSLLSSGSNGGALGLLPPPAGPGVVFVHCSILERLSWAACYCVGNVQSRA